MNLPIMAVSQTVDYLVTNIKLIPYMIYCSQSCIVVRMTVLFTHLSYDNITHLFPLLNVFLKNTLQTY